MSLRLKTDSSDNSIEISEAEIGRLVIITSSNISWALCGEVYAVGNDELVDLTTEAWTSKDSLKGVRCRYVTSKDHLVIMED